LTALIPPEISTSIQPLDRVSSNIAANSALTTAHGLSRLARSSSLRPIALSSKTSPRFLCYHFLDLSLSAVDRARRYAGLG
jgi:hypothetical protein